MDNTWRPRAGAADGLSEQPEGRHHHPSAQALGGKRPADIRRAPCKVYILEVYADRSAYEAHLKTAHFKKYKEGTAGMVKSLKLIDTKPLLRASMDKSAIR